MFDVRLEVSLIRKVGSYLGKKPTYYQDNIRWVFKHMNPCKGCEYRQIFLSEENETKMVFCRKFNCDRDNARSKCERWEGMADPSAEDG
jgi:hypothetical protein